MSDGHHAGTRWLSEGRRRQLGDTILLCITGLTTTSTGSPGLPLRCQMSRTKVLERLAGLALIERSRAQDRRHTCRAYGHPNTHSLTSRGGSINSQFQFGARRKPEETEGDTSMWTLMWHSTSRADRAILTLPRPFSGLATQGFPPVGSRKTISAIPVAGFL